MCPPAEEERKSAAAPAPAANNNTTLLVAFCAVVTVTSLIAAIVLGMKAADSNGNSGVQQIEVVQAEPPTIVVQTGDQKWATDKPPEGENVCAGKKIELDNVQCVVDAVTNVGPQSGANVTKGYKGDLEVDHVPITTPYYQQGMCPVNVHWHLGTEHYSAGEYDETGTYPSIASDEDILDRRDLAEQAKAGYHCKLYKENDPMFNTPYVWKHCVGMVVGETYEVHWPHSAVGACNTPNQYQTPFYDGVFCNLDLDTLLTLQPQDIASAVGVQAQVFTIVNDEDYYYPDLFRGMIVDGEMGQDIHYYTGSTTGTSRNNTICSSYSPITWQVDRKCHMISASSFDKMCADMKSQRDDMSDDLYAHGSRDLVDDAFVANNGQRERKARNLRA